MTPLRVLALIPDVTDPPITGVRVRDHYLWPAMASLGHDVRILGLRQDRNDEPRGPANVRSEFFDFAREILPLRALHASMYSFHQWPRSREMYQAVANVCQEFKPQVVHAETLRLADYLPPSDTQSLRSVTFHNVESDLYRPVLTTAKSLRQRLCARWHLRHLLKYERETLARADTVFAYSPTDLSRYRQIHPAGRWELTSNGAAVEGVTVAPDPDAGKVLLIASLSYYPNIEGLNWFLDHVKRLLAPGARVTVAGSRAGEQVRARLKSEGVNFIDTPPDLAPLYAASSVAAIPLLSGSGTRGRLLEALAFGRVVVTTTKGAEGLDLWRDEGVIIADHPSDFADQINGFLRDPSTRNKLAAAGRAAVEQRYSWRCVAEGMVQVWHRCKSQSSK